MKKPKEEGKKAEQPATEDRGKNMKEGDDNDQGGGQGGNGSGGQKKQL